MTEQELEKNFWGAAIVLRGNIDTGDYEQYISPLKFFKCLYDVYNEELKGFVRSDVDMKYEAFAENHHFVVPENTH
ncbi:type I restriction-modification system subunit M N-terminal domain-containing protein [Pseudotamlana agarivorans]|uniref:type I restriction-modification system subunit M N-terminal domain-containing protein n=1 Tax=Pseudotamlana agarivorans TaxID=481183 RepID=UPI0008364BCD|nr:type I restriction-modification system subunit M N-terminal domain-containing protein [Tamlana agarivorans]